MSDPLPATPDAPAEAAPLSDIPHAPQPAHKKGRMSALTLGALGVVFGDIGTSPLYAFRESVRVAGGGLASHLVVM
ncbi:MAG TPA: KUP/HAK/KT family potassium transporter, partial [Rhizomicrobium sp.]|nr:KUP/HAK/KT family potassium transporter [Rhizomicrobium sp.]